MTGKCDEKQGYKNQLTRKYSSSEVQQTWELLSQRCWDLQTDSVKSEQNYPWESPIPVECTSRPSDSSERCTIPLQSGQRQLGCSLTRCQTLCGPQRWGRCKWWRLKHTISADSWKRVPDLLCEGWWRRLRVGTSTVGGLAWRRTDQKKREGSSILDRGKYPISDQWSMEHWYIET